MTTAWRSLGRLACCLGVAALLGCARQEAAESTQDEAAPNLPARSERQLREAPQYVVVSGTQGALRQATLFVFKSPSVASTFEVRSLAVTAKGAELSSDRETLYEVLSGEVEAGSANARRLHRTGDLWLVDPKISVVLRARGEIAVLRAITVK